MNSSPLLESSPATPATARGTNWRTLAEQGYQAALPLVFLILALLVFPSRLTAVGMVGVLALCGLRWAARSSPFPVLKLNPFLLVLLLMFTYGLATTPSPDIAWMRAGHLLAGVLVLMTLVDRADSQAHIIAAMGIVVLVAVVFAFGAPFGTAWSGVEGFNLKDLTSRYVPLLSRLSNVNSVSGALEASVPLAFALIAANRKPWRLVGTLSLAPLIVMLLLLQSRGALLAVVLGMTVYATLYRRWVLPFVPLVLLGGLWLNSAFGDLLPAQLLGGGDTESVVTLGDRTEVWREGLRLLSQAPLTGIGVNGFAALGKPVIGEGTGRYVLANSHSHNLLLEIALDTGVIGAAAFIGILVLAILAAWRVYRARLDPPMHALAIGVLAAFVVILTHGMFDLIYWGFKGGLFLWATIGLALALYHWNATPSSRDRITPI